MLLSVNGNKLLFECFIKANDSKHPLSPLSPDLWEKNPAFAYYPRYLSNVFCAASSSSLRAA